ncbi:Gag-pol fusion protein [Phytophthora cinnamomi]|uniref:Gag-pol fusion protein n=1 Tax=Phytophthora cinnamomi TaxID=4785 RepID=UPI00355A8DA0|nr:Gag-pol fusion protein [Phytophthora cinnamomi]
MEDQIIDERVTKMLDAGIIEEGNGAWGFPVVLVRKKDGEVRVCVDYRALNKVTKKDVYSFPRIDEKLEALGRALLFSTLDLRAGYWQMRVAPEDRDKTAFTTKKGLYRFVRVPFGLTNASSTVQRMMKGVLRGLTCLVYLDDIVFFKRGGFERHVVEMANMVERLDQTGLTLK